MKAIFHANGIELEGFGYFIGKASSVSFGAWGDKRKPATDPNYLAVHDVLPAPKLAQVKLNLTPLDVQVGGPSVLSYLAALAVAGLGGGKVGLKASDFETGRVRLLKVSPRGDKELIDAINASPKVIEQLVAFGGSARVVVDVLIAVETERYKRFGQIVGDAVVAVVDGMLRRQGGSVSTDPDGALAVGPGTVVGYSLAEPRWNANLDRNKTAVESLRADSQGW